MTTISAKDVSALRKATGAGMMDCKEALKESGGDMDGALDFLRKKGQKVAAKRADREANEGVVVTLEKDGKAVVMALSCELTLLRRMKTLSPLLTRLPNWRWRNNPRQKTNIWRWSSMVLPLLKS